MIRRAAAVAVLSVACIVTAVARQAPPGGAATAQGQWTADLRQLVVRRRQSRRGCR